MREESEIKPKLSPLQSVSAIRRCTVKVCVAVFRYGITPPRASCISTVERRAGAPAEALAKFWEDLRGKARVEIDHPDLPEALKAAGERSACCGLRQQVGTRELAVLRVEARTEAQSAHTELQELNSEALAWR